MTITSGIEPGDKAPDFKLKNANPSIYGDIVSFSQSMGENGLIVMFTCNHCPYVVGSESRIEKISLKAKNNALGFVGINSNDPINYTTDSWENMVKRAKSGMSYAYLVDETQEIAKNYGAERTPEFYLIDSSGIVVYRGRLDNSPRDPSHATTSDLSDAIDELIAGEEISQIRNESIGCSVKWKI
ncbi:MAG: thioredoxin family protein [Candidatus Poseidoniales archaeon]|nr:MAG: thioredoxin family protein [Candidatus Poseidoniales archaeon]|tara:strand:+ start:984 stop:1538 length:555 start_codon:yes stop_codon:yes gene_type:complete